jgi:hypothetical protein
MQEEDQSDDGMKRFDWKLLMDELRDYIRKMFYKLPVYIYI